MSEDLSRLPIRRSGIELRDKGGDIVLAEVGRTETYALNPMARAVWDCAMERPRSKSWRTPSVRSSKSKDQQHVQMS